ncbi:MFS transporter [Salimicrobium halophilum]|uniref:Predicted arabinose efflux permease, MFS family n=1 Tax=Salimicrobium halophilum TaxID=86666 RepID=A0A1G8R0P8_9BACI|nr:MFS transporter [Salimicrobium halophilum]SDJ10556.1 Predicted arabinose efflux permease, MFS family [Salimicrobium halophilum]
MEQSLWKNKNYVTLMSAQLVSSLGDWLSMIAIFTMVGMRWEASPLEVSLTMLSLAVPMALFGPFAGVVSDKFPRKSLMITSDLIRAGLIIGLAFATSIWMVYGFLFAIGCFSAVFIPSKNGKLKEIVEEHNLKSAMSVTSAIDSGTKIAGPLLSGLLVTVFPVSTVFFIDSGTFLLSALLLLFVAGDRVVTAETKREPSSFQKDWIEGFHFMKEHVFLLSGLVIIGSGLLILQLADSQFIVLIRQLTDASPDLFGYLITASGVGMLTASVILAKKTDYNAFLLMISGMTGLGISFSLLGWFTQMDLGYSTLWMIILGFVAGFTSSLGFIPFQASIQVTTPSHLTGRVFGVVNSVTTIATIVGPLTGGILATVYGVIPIFISTGVLLVLLSLTFYINRRKLHGTENERSLQTETAEGHT